MTLPFTTVEFFQVFTAYNQSVWPLQALLTLLAVLLSGVALLAPRQAGRIVGLGPAVLWAWLADGYHLAFFHAINPAAPLFAALSGQRATEYLIRWRGTGSISRSPVLDCRGRNLDLPSHGLRRIMHPPLLTLAIATGLATGTNAPVAQFDLERYSGTWHEIAHLPMLFQRNCVDHISATYTPLPDGTIQVRNACRTNDGSMNESTGVARPVEGKPGQLKVRFAPDWLAWLPMVWADYWVIDLDPRYQWAVVGGPTHKYLWVLSRTPTMDRGLFELLRSRARERGYPVDRLVMAAPLD